MDMLLTCSAKKKITHVSGHEKNLHPGGHKLIFFNQFSGDILLSSLISVAFLILVSFVCLFVCLFHVF